MDWKDTEFSQKHQVSSTGLIRNKKSGRILNPWKNKNGYLVVRFSKGGKNYMVHRVVASAFLENPNKLPIINHKNGIVDDNRVDNIEWCNHSYNYHHSVEIGLHDGSPNKGHKNSVGSKNTMSVLKEDDIREIRKLKKQGLTLKQIGDIFNVHFATIGYIVQGKTWSHVK